MFGIDRKSIGGVGSIFKISLVVLLILLINTVQASNCNSDKAEPSSIKGMETAYWELKEYQGNLKENIILLKEEREAKEACLAELDNRFAELESQYKELLEQKKRISDELAAVNAGKE
ncbi:MAG TPA: hypothetical protein VN580_08760 [Clostridia bacterium]|nr:hypothetical protein [Clostridia bacterium]